MRADELVKAAEIIRSQLPHQNRIWINSMASQDIGADVSRLVQDVQYIEKTGTRRPRTWPRAGDHGLGLVPATMKLHDVHGTPWDIRYAQTLRIIYKILIIIS